MFSSVFHVCIVCVVFAELNSAISRLGSQRVGPRVSSGQETSDTSGDETDGSGRRQKRSSRKRYTLKKSHATSELASSLLLEHQTRPRIRVLLSVVQKGYLHCSERGLRDQATLSRP